MNPGTCKVPNPKASVFLKNETKDFKQGASNHKLFNLCWFSQDCIQGGSKEAVLRFSLLSDCISKFHLFRNCMLPWVIYELLLLLVSRISPTLLLSASDCYIPLICCCFTYKPFRQPVFFQLQNSKETVQRNGKDVFTLGSSNLGT